jgi:peptidoglycan/LPS O-acetylase OafA/YrhL
MKKSLPIFPSTAQAATGRIPGRSAMNDLANLDILRSIAVLLVVAAHLMMYTRISGFYQWTSWMGLAGVSLFFVHTCLVLMWSLERDPHTGRFYIRRLFRLFPLWLVVLGLVVTLHVPVSPTAAPQFGYIKVGIPELLANATMTFNLRYGARIVGASWSLPIEAQMYLLLPLLFFFIRSTRALWVLLVIDGLAIASVWTVYGIHSAPNATLAICIPYFLPGVMAYTLTKKVRAILPAWSFVVFLLGIVVVGFLPGMVAADQRDGTLFRSCFFCLAVGLALPFFRQVSWRPAVRTSHLVARYSYGIYLCHIPSICVGLHYLRGHSFALRLASIPIVLTITSVALYHGIEAPMIRLGSRLAKKIEPGPSPKVNEITLSLEPAP